MFSTSHVRPFLTAFATPKEPAPALPGRYCDDRDLWVVDTPIGTVPLANNCEAAMSTETRVGGEQPDRGFEALLATATETAVGSERPDRSLNAVMSALATITEIGGEQLDSPARLRLELETLTKVEGESTDR